MKAIKNKEIGFLQVKGKSLGQVLSASVGIPVSERFSSSLIVQKADLHDVDFGGKLKCTVSSSSPVIISIVSMISIYFLPSSLQVPATPLSSLRCAISGLGHILS